jgi:hypothetical protein
MLHRILAGLFLLASAAYISGADGYTSETNQEREYMMYVHDLFRGEENIYGVLVASADLKDPETMKQKIVAVGYGKLLNYMPSHITSQAEISEILSISNCTITIFGIDRSGNKLTIDNPTIKQALNNGTYKLRADVIRHDETRL